MRDRQAMADASAKFEVFPFLSAPGSQEPLHVTTVWARTYRMRWRFAVSAAIGFASGAFCWFLMKHLHQDAADFRWAMHLAHRLLARQNPYDTPLEQYPLTAALFALPFVRLQPEMAAALFWGISSFFLALGLTRHGYTRLLIFFAYPYWAGLLTVQWSPIIAASGFFPLLLPAAMAKPQVGLPVFLTRLSRRGLLACLVVGLLSLAVMPRWPVLWLQQTRNYEHFVPILVLPGALLVLALLRYRNRDARLLFLSALMPQRWFFDSFILWLIPQITPRNYLDCLLQLGSGNLALVSHSHKLHPGRALYSDLSLSAHVGGCAAEKRTKDRRCRR